MGKKILILLTMLLGLSLFAEEISVDKPSTLTKEEQKEAYEILERMREKIEKERELRIKAEEEARKKAEEEALLRAKAEEEARLESERLREEEQKEKLQAEKVEEEKAVAEKQEKKDPVTEYINYRNEKEYEEKHSKSGYDKMKYTYKKSLENMDFYERVARSVQREEALLKGYDEVLSEDIGIKKAEENSETMEAK